MNKKLSKELSARTADDSSTKADKKHVSPAIAKPHVSCSTVDKHLIFVLIGSCPTPCAT